MKKIFSKFICIIIFCFTTVSYTYAQPIHALFINPDEDSSFWISVTEFMKSVSKDLNIDLQVVYAKNRLDHVKVAKQAIVEYSPDYLLTLFQVGTGRHQLEAAEAANVRTFVFNTSVPPRERERLGVPRQKYKHWIGHMYPDDVYAGYILADSLIRKAKIAQTQASDGKIHLVGINGSLDSPATIDRNVGLQQALEQHPDTILNQTVYTDWSHEDAYYRTSKLLSRYLETSVIWTASDGMAIGAVQAILESGRKLGTQVFTGGVDWSPEGLDAVKNQQILGSVGGHFMEGGWSLILLYDYHHGVDFSESMGTTIRSRMEMVTQENIEAYYTFVKDSDWDAVDFRTFSKTLNPDQSDYNFSLSRIVRSDQ